MPPFKRILITGGAGFIGSHTVDALLESGCEVRVLDCLDPQVHGAGATRPAYLAPEAELIVGDVLDRPTLERALEGCDALIHDAAAVGVGQSQYEIDRYTRINSLGTALLFDVLVNTKHSIERVLVASSMSIYGEGLYERPSDRARIAPPPRPTEQLARGRYEVLDSETGEELHPIPTPETKPLHCTSIYALTKKTQEETALIAARAHGLSVVACRFFNVYGPRQALSNPYTGVAAIFLSRLKNGNAPMIYEDGKQSRDFIHVRDLVEAQIFLMSNPNARNDVYNICTGRATSVAEMAMGLASECGRGEIAPEIVSRFRSGDIRHCVGDKSKLAALGWTPRIALEEGLADLVRWASEQDAADHVATAHEELLRRGLIQGQS